MKPSVEKGLASHSSILVAPHEFSHGCEDGDGWIQVSSKESLHKNKISKDISFFSAENNQDKISSATDSNKSDSSRSSWASILKISLKMDVPRVSTDIASTSSNSKNSRFKQWDSIPNSSTYLWRQKWDTPIPSTATSTSNHNSRKWWGISHWIGVQWRWEYFRWKGTPLKHRATKTTWE